MAGRRTNIALLLLLTAALASGAVSFAVGTPAHGWAAVAHGIAGLGVLVMTPWKSTIVRRGLARRRRSRAASIALLAAVASALIAGVLHSSGLARALGPVTTMQLHVGAALLALPLAAWHLIARPVRIGRSDVSRRQLLRSGLLLAGAGGAYLGIEGALRLARLPGGRRRFTGSYETGSLDPERMPVTQWLNDSIPSLDASTWRLTVDAGGPRSWALEELERFDDEARALIDCTGGWWSEQVWRGVHLRRLLGDESGRSITVTSVTGYARTFPWDALDSLLLATGVGGAPLSNGHGAPARLVAPGRRGFWWVKWVVRVEVSDRPWWLQSPFPLT